MLTGLLYLAASRAAVRLIRYLSGVTAGGSLPLLLLCFTNCALHSEADETDFLFLSPLPGVIPSQPGALTGSSTTAAVFFPALTGKMLSGSLGAATRRKLTHGPLTAPAAYALVLLRRMGLSPQAT